MAASIFDAITVHYRDVCFPRASHGQQQFELTRDVRLDEENADDRREKLRGRRCQGHERCTGHVLVTPTFEKKTPSSIDFLPV